jgi:hypothetical protein
MAHNPKFHGLLRDMAEMHDRKNNDYASAGNPYANFEFAGQLAAGFTAPVDIAFATLIGVKLARLIELKGKGKTPRNESIQDSFLDLAVYAALWASYDYEVKEERVVPEMSIGASPARAQEELADYFQRLRAQKADPTGPIPLEVCPACWRNHALSEGCPPLSAWDGQALPPRQPSLSE